MPLKVPERYRLKKGPMGSDESYGNNGCFHVPTFDANVTLTVIASNEGGWEHVSVSNYNRTPTWEEMEYIKRMFWEDSDLVLQFHPPLKQYINKCENCLHMWRSLNASPPELPPAWMVA